MCKGIAILINDKEILMNEKTNSHSELVGKREDNFLKINCIYDDSTTEGYRFEIDNHNKEQIKEYQKQGYVNEKKEIIESYMKRLYAFCKAKEHLFFRLFAKYLHSATIKGDQYNISATIKGDQYNYSATIEGDQYNDSATIKGDQSNNSATIKGAQYNISATIKGDQYNYSATIKGAQSNISATIKGDIIIYNMKNGDKKTQKLLDRFTKENNDNSQNATFNNFVKWLLLKNRGKQNV